MGLNYAVLEDLMEVAAKSIGVSTDGISELCARKLPQEEWLDEAYKLLNDRRTNGA